MPSPLTPTKETGLMFGGSPSSPSGGATKKSPSPKESPPQKEEKRSKEKPKKKEISPPPLRERRERSPSPPPTHEGSYTDTFETGGSKTEDNVSSLQEEANKKETKKKGKLTHHRNV